MQLFVEFCIVILSLGGRILCFVQCGQIFLSAAAILNHNIPEWLKWRCDPHLVEHYSLCLAGSLAIYVLQFCCMVQGWEHARGIHDHLHLPSLYDKVHDSGDHCSMGFL